MMRFVLAFAIAVCVGASAAAQQSTVLTVTAARADVRMSPTIVSPVVGQAPQGMVLDVTREVGDWVKVSWPEGPGGIGYVRLTGGTLSKAAAPAAKRAVEPSTPAESATPDVTAVRADIEAVERRALARSQASEYVLPRTHTMGFGALVSGSTSSTLGFGASGRFWSRGGFGAQVAM